MLRTIHILLILWFHATAVAFAGGERDTVMIAVLNLGYPVNSVLNAEDGNVYLTGAKGMEKRNASGEFEVVDELQTTPVFWTGSELVDGSIWTQMFNMDPFFPGEPWCRYFGRKEAYSEARIDSSRSLVCDGYRVFEMEFRSKEGVFLEGNSIRGFRWVEGELVANSYQGIFRGDERIPGIQFNDGPVLEHDGWVISMGQFVVRWPIHEPERIELIHWPDSAAQEWGSYFERRDGVVWKDRIWWHSFGRFGVFEEGIWKVLTTEIDVLHAIPMDDRLLLSTRHDGVWSFDGEQFESMGWPLGIEYYDVHAVDEERYLVATNHGLAIADQRTGDFILRSIDEGIPSASVCAIEVDSWGTYWISTFSGVIRYSLEHGVLEHHLPLVEFNRFSHAKAPDGRIAFGSTGGVYTVAATPPVWPEEGEPIAWLSWMFAIALAAVILKGRLNANKMRQQQEEVMERQNELERQAFVAEIRGSIYRDLQGASVDAIAQELGMSRRTLYRKCADFDIKPSNMIREIRVEYARRLMSRGEVTFQELADRVGYSPNHLRRMLNGEE